MNHFLDFMTLRPMLTVRIIRIVWWLYLLIMAFSLNGFWSVFQHTPVLTAILYLLPNLMELVVRVAIVRILLEVALRILESKTIKPD
jgi:hypothetical protein